MPSYFHDDEKNDQNRSVQEFLKDLRALNDTDRNRLMLFAKKRCLLCRFEAFDLFNEAIARTIEGVRNYPSNVDIVKFLFETMRSIASSEIKSLERHGELSLTANDMNTNGHQLDVCDNSSSPEQQVISELEAGRIKDEIINLFNDDVTAQFIVECWIEDMTPEEIRDATGLDKTKYNSKLRKMRRRMNAYIQRGLTNE